MKTIIASLKAQIEAEKKKLHTLESEKDKLFDEAFEVCRTDRAKGEQMYKDAVKIEDEYHESYNKLRCMRQALSYLLDAIHEEYDHFQPELSC